MHNNELIDTAAGRWKDSGDGSGIVPADPDDDDEGEDRSDSSSILSDTYSAISSELQDNEATHYAGLDETKDENWLQKKTKELTPAGMRKEILRKTVRWVLVSDCGLSGCN